MVIPGAVFADINKDLSENHIETGRHRFPIQKISSKVEDWGLTCISKWLLMTMLRGLALRGYGGCCNPKYEFAS